MRVDNYYAQTTEFTCAPACLMMAMNTLDPEKTFRLEDEFQIWREANSVFMGEGHPGCAPHALAIAAMARGYDVKIWLWNTDDLFADWTRKRSHKEVMLMMEAYDIQRAADLGIVPEVRKFQPADIRPMMDAGFVPIVLTAEGIEAHWVVITHMTDDTVYIHDPYIDREKGKVREDCLNVPHTRKNFKDMMIYGRRNAQAVVLIGRGKS